MEMDIPQLHSVVFSVDAMLPKKEPASPGIEFPAKTP